jgi:hypothetical protein
VRIRFVKGDSKICYANMKANGGGGHRIAFLPTRSSSSSRSTVNVVLRAGDNTVAFAGIDGGWGPDIDRVSPATS